MAVGIVLSGGGARGDFQVGALRYLYEKNIRPQVLTGCSVGAINAIKLAEGEGDGNDPSRGLQGLTNIWRGLNNNGDMWQEEDWLKNIKNSKVAAFLKQSAASQIGAVGLEVAKLGLGVIGWIWVARDIAQTVKDLDEFKRELDKIINASSRSLYNLNPILDKLNDPSRLDINKVKQSGIKLRLAAVALESGALRYVTETGEMLERDNHTKVVASELVLSPECRPIASKIEGLKQERASLQEELHNEAGNGKAPIVAAIRNLTAEISQLTAQLNSCKLANPAQPSTLRVSLVQGVMASASIPLAFPPVKLGSENYVDGGVREIAPIQVAIQEGATEVFAIIASNSSMEPAHSLLTGKRLPSFDVGVANIGDVANRAANDIMTNETVLNETDPPNGWGANVTIIEPNFDIHDIMTIDPGLIDIRMAHGYMRTDDILKAKKENAADYRRIANEYGDSRLTTEIIQTRKAIWEKEYAANGFLLQYDDSGAPIYPAQPIQADPQAILEVRELKNKLKELVNKRRAEHGEVPADAETWWTSWERHSWSPTRDLWMKTGPAATGDDMTAGEVLGMDQPIQSPNGVYTFVYQGDGNLVLYQNIRLTGSISPACQPIAAQIENIKSEISSLQSELAGASAREKSAILARVRMLTTQLNSQNTKLRDCNAANPPQTTTRRTAIWASNTVGAVGVCIMQPDGNLVIYDQANQPRWSSNTWGHDNSRLVVQDDGNVVIYRSDGRPVWASRG